MDIDETESKIEKSDTKLPFSIENLLADKFVQNDPKEGPSTSAGYFTKDDEVPCETDEEDRESNLSSEHVDVEGSTADAHEFLDDKRHDYQQSGN